MRPRLSRVRLRTGDFPFTVHGMRKGLIASTFILPVLTGCGGNADEPSATVTVTERETVTVPALTETSTSTPEVTETTEVDPYAPNVGARALHVGETREGEDVRTTIVEVRDNMTHPSNPYIKASKGTRWLGVDVEQCVRKSAPRASVASTYDIQAADNSGGVYTVDGSSWEDWPPLPQYPYDRRLQPGQCARGWMLLVVAKDAKVKTIQFSDYHGGGDVIAEWRLR